MPSPPLFCPVTAFPSFIHLVIMPYFPLGLEKQGPKDQPVQVTPNASFDIQPLTARPAQRSSFQSSPDESCPLSWLSASTRWRRGPCRRAAISPAIPAMPGLVSLFPLLPCRGTSAPFASLDPPICVSLAGPP